MTVLSAPCSPSNLSAVTLVGSQNSDNNDPQSSSPEVTSADTLTAPTTTSAVKNETSATIREKSKVERTTSEEGNR